VENPNLYGETIEAILEQSTGELAEDFFIGYPDKSLITALFQVLDTEEERQIRLLMDEESEQSMTRNFLTATKLAELATEGIEIRISSNVQTNALTDGGQVIVPIDVPNHAVGLVDTDEEFVQSLSKAYEDSWSQASPYNPDVPPRSALVEQLEEITTEDLAADFEAVLSATESIGSSGNTISVVTLSLLLTARHEALLYDLSQWGETTGLASKATFSRAKTNLEEQGIIDTESVPIEVGRPRHRLVLKDQKLRAATPEEFVQTAWERIQ
jgi:hypothetical protein